MTCLASSGLPPLYHYLLDNKGMSCTPVLHEAHYVFHGSMLGAYLFYMDACWRRFAYIVEAYWRCLPCSRVVTALVLLLLLLPAHASSMAWLYTRPYLSSPRSAGVCLATCLVPFFGLAACLIGGVA